MNISVSYPQDRARTVRICLRVNRRTTRVLQSCGAVSLLAAVIVGATSHHVGTATAIWAVLGIVLIIEPRLLFWLTLRRNWEAFAGDVTVTLTDSGVAQRTKTASVELGWGMIRQVIQEKDFWVFMVNRLRFVTLWKGALTSEQEAELARFLAARPL